MNPILQKTETVLTRAEEELRKLIGEAGLAGDYEAVDLSRIAASRIREVRTSLCNGESAGHSERNHVEATDTPRPMRSATRARKTSRRNRGKAGEYPKFFTRNGTLCKVGWSKKAKEEYVHKVPKDAFDRTLAAIAFLSASSKNPFTVEQVVERTERDGEEVSGYQVYVILALLRKKQVLHRQGREGYVAGGDVARAAATAWASLGG